MTTENRVDRNRRGMWISVIAIVGPFVLDFLSNVFANYVHPTGAWFRHDSVLVVSAVVSALGAAGLVLFGRRWRAAQRSRTNGGRATDTAELVQPGRSFPPPAALVGRPGAVRSAVAERARRHRAVVVTGPAGIGASAVAVGAGWELAPTPDRQRYVDLRGSPRGPENQRRAVIRVLRVIGLRPGGAQDPRLAIATMADTLRGKEIVLVLDNAESAEQISWIADGVPGAYVIACGDIPERELPGGVARVRVPPLDSEAALKLLARQGDSERRAAVPDGSRRMPAPGRGRGWSRLLPGRLAGHLAEMLDRHRGSAPNSVAERIAADPDAAVELARSYLGLPRVTIDMGRWLAANPQVRLAALVQDLRGTEPNSELTFIVRRQLDGTSADARRLLALLAAAPTAELPQAAIAALAGTGLDRTGDHLTELASRSLVEWSRPSRCRITPPARRLAEPPGRKALARSYARLAAYYARLAVARGEALQSGGLAQVAEEWLRAEDAAMLQLLSAQGPPARAATSLWPIADVLDIWFAREQRPEDRRAAAQAMADAADFLHHGTAGAVASLRLAAAAREEGDLATAGKNLERAQGLLRRGRALQSQLHAEWAVYLMTVGDLEAAWDHLLRCRDIRPPRDVRGRTADLINQAAVELRRGSAEDAHATLMAALALAEDAADHGGRAHAHELLGVMAWRTGQQKRAFREWTQALRLYEQAADVSGQARCLQHLGTATVSEEGGDARDAAGLLDRSLILRGDHQAGLGLALAHLYLAEAEDLSGAELLAHRKAGLDALQAWPHQGSEPPEVTSARTRLIALGSDRPVGRQG
jgi:tetratricopeptide (TPR) repeat protein